MNVLAGAAVAIAVTLFVAMEWQTLYAGHPWPGYGRAAAAGTIPHQFNSSPRARNHVLIIFAAAGFILGVLRFSNMRSLLFSWAGLSAGLFLLFIASPAGWHSNLAQFSIILFAIEALPLLFAGFVGYAAKRAVLALAS